MKIEVNVVQKVKLVILESKFLNMPLFLSNSVFSELTKIQANFAEFVLGGREVKNASAYPFYVHMAL